MTSGTFRSVEIDSISVNRAGRQRKEISQEDIESLGESIRKIGLIHPIVIQRETHELIAGERRYLAHKWLGLTHVMSQYADEVDPTELKIIELEENTRRKDLTWQEQCLAIDEFHTIMSQRDSSWTQDSTAAALLLKQETVSEKLAVAKEIKAGNSIIADAPKFSTARGIVRRAESRRGDEVVAQIMEIEGAPRPQAVEPVILNLDFHQWQQTYSGPLFNFIHCDFPYGIGADKRQQGYTHQEHGSYADTEDHYWSLLLSLRDSLPRVAAESCHLMFWFSMRFYCETKQRLEDMGWAIDPFPLIWTKTDNIGLLPDPERGPRRIYETAFYGSRGDRKIVRATSNSIGSASVRDGHMSEKSQLALEGFFKMFVDGSTSILDPTAGSGSALRAAKALGASYLKGLEINEEFAKRANERLK
jgi:ParB/RepB/Spo0J family partition protein